MPSPRGTPDWWRDPWAGGNYPPPTQLQYIGLNSIGNSTNLIAAPGAGQALRLFALTLAASGAGANSGGVLSLGTIVIGCRVGSGISLSFPPLGLVAPANAACVVGPNNVGDLVDVFIAYDVVPTT